MLYALKYTLNIKFNTYVIPFKFKYRLRYNEQSNLTAQCCSLISNQRTHWAEEVILPLYNPRRLRRRGIK